MFLSDGFPPEKIHRVQFPSGISVFRPDLHFDGVSERDIEVKLQPNSEVVACRHRTLSVFLSVCKQLYMLIKTCWDEDPERRPDFKRIELTLGKIFRYVNSTL